MAKFCGKCGNELKEGSKFCVVCGAPVPGMSGAQNGTQNKQPVSYANPKAGVANTAASKKKPAWLMAIPVVVIVVIAAVMLMGGKGYEKPIEYMEKGINEGDMSILAKAFSGDISSMIPESSVDILGAGQELELTIVDAEKLDKAEMEEVLTEDFYLTRHQAANAKKAYILTVNATITGGDAEDEDEGEEEIVVIKQDGKWVIPVPLGF